MRSFYGCIIGLAALAACGDNSTAHITISGHVTGLQGSGLVLVDNGGDDLTVSADGDFTFASTVTQS